MVSRASISRIAIYHHNRPNDQHCRCHQQCPSEMMTTGGDIKLSTKLTNSSCNDMCSSPGRGFYPFLFGLFSFLLGFYSLLLGSTHFSDGFSPVLLISLGALAYYSWVLLINQGFSSLLWGFPSFLWGFFSSLIGHPTIALEFLRFRTMPECWGQADIITLKFHQWASTHHHWASTQ